MTGRAELVEKKHPELSLRTQCALLGVARSTLDYKPVGPSREDVALMRILDEIYLRDPCLGTRRLVPLLERDYKLQVNRKRVRRLRQIMGVETIWCRPRTSTPDDGHRKYPYLLRNLSITKSDQVWCADITYVPMPQGHAYLCAVMDWYSRKVLGWALSNTMDGKGRWMDNVFIERLWRSVKYEEIYLREYSNLPATETGLELWFNRYNGWRPHQALGNQTPSQIYARGNKKIGEGIKTIKNVA